MNGKMLFKTAVGVALLLLLFAAGCAEITPKDTVDAAMRPLGADNSLRIGMKMDEIKAEWGDPDQVIDRGTNELGAPKVEWVYNARYRGVPMDIKYMSKTKHMIFEGKVLTKWSSE